MLFNSVSFLIFMIAAVSSFALVPMRWRIPLVSAFSVAFYATWRWEFIFLLTFTTGVDYYAARIIAATDAPRRRKAALIGALAVNLGLLIGFKYTQMLVDTVHDLLALAVPDLAPVGGSSPDLGFILPLGISFYTFHSISYTVDVYRGHVAPIRRYLTFFAYVTFWPQLIAGPILRAAEIVPQLENPRRPDREMLISGMERVVLGLFKKVALADPLSLLVDKVFATDPALIGAMPAAEVMLGAFLFGFQIYLDFSAYSDIAIGSARMMGIRFPENFNWPYLSQNPREFWQRWHISLSSWIRDYLYLPLLSRQSGTASVGGIRDDERGRRTWALFLTWFIMGLWHGANWTFALWGLYHATILIAYRSLWRLGAGQAIDRLGRLGTIFAWASTLFVMMMGWLFFRAESLDQLGMMLHRLISLDAYGFITTHRTSYFAVLAVLIVGMLAAKAVEKVYIKERMRLDRMPGAVAYVTFFAILLTAIIVALQPVNQFIYFQF